MDAMARIIEILLQIIIALSRGIVRSKEERLPTVPGTDNANSLDDAIEDAGRKADAKFGRDRTKDL